MSRYGVWRPLSLGAGGPGYYYKDGIFIRSMGDPNADPESSAYKTFAAISEDGLSVEGYINTPEAREGMEWFQDLTMEWQVSPKVGIPGAFLDGRAAMDIADDWMIGDVKWAHPEGGFNYGASPIPYFNTSVTMTGSSTFAVSSQTKHPAEVAALLIWTHPQKTHTNSGRRKVLCLHNSLFLNWLRSTQTYPIGSSLRN